jgi:hypothetical protein
MVNNMSTTGQLLLSVVLTTSDSSYCILLSSPPVRRSCAIGSKMPSHVRDALGGEKLAAGRRRRR